MPRAVWTGSLRFGLVSIPVALYPATKPKDVRFHLFDREGRRVRYRRVAEHAEVEKPALAEERTEEAASARITPSRPDAGTGEAPSLPKRQLESQRPLEYGDLVRGYEVEPGRFAMLEHEEVERARPTRSATIELEDFVELGAIDPVFFEKTYYVTPRPDAAKAYRLLNLSLARTNRVGIGRFVLRTKPHLVALRPTGEAIALETLFFGDEVRSPDEVLLRVEEPIDEREVRLAEQLVGMLAADWDPSRYADDYREELLRIIGEKTLVETEEANETLAGVPVAGIEQLMDALRRSVEDAKAGREERERSRETG